MTDGTVSGSIISPDGKRMVTMSQDSFDAIMGDTKRETREKTSKEYETLIDERAALKAAEIAEKKAEELFNRREEERKQKDQQEKMATQQAELKKTADRLNSKFQDAAKKHADFNDLAADYEWQDERNAKILPCLDDDEIDNAGDVLHHLMKEGEIEKLSLRTPAYIKKKMKEVSQRLKDESDETSARNEKTPPEPISRHKPSHIPSRGEGRPLKAGDLKGRAFRN